MVTIYNEQQKAVEAVVVAIFNPLWGCRQTSTILRIALHVLPNGGTDSALHAVIGRQIKAPLPVLVSCMTVCLQARFMKSISSTSFTPVFRPHF